jgi:hypothetical protein
MASASRTPLFSMYPKDDPKKNLFIEEIKKIGAENKRYVLIYPSSRIEDQHKCANIMLKSGFDATIELGSFKSNVKIVKYISIEDGKSKMWILHVKDMKNKAKKGLMVRREIKTGIDDESDFMSDIDYIDSLFYDLDDENYKKNKKFKVLSFAKKIPSDFPRRKDMKLAVIAGDAFIRENNFNNPTTYLAPIMIALNGIPVKIIKSVATNSTKVEPTEEEIVEENDEDEWDFELVFDEE